MEIVKIIIEVIRKSIDIFINYRNKRKKPQNIPQKRNDGVDIIKLPPSFDKYKYKRTYNIFISSPNGLEEERAAFLEEIRIYNKTDANHRGIHFYPVDWNDITPTYGRAQDEINRELYHCEEYVLILWDRFGTPTKKNGKSIYDSGSEEEFYEALKCKKNDEYPMDDIVVLFKKIEEGKAANPDEQCQKVKDFKERICEMDILFYQEFDSLEKFKEWIRAVHAKITRKLEKEINRIMIKGDRDVVETGSPNEDIKYRIIDGN
jgi:hypothetical protein